MAVPRVAGNEAFVRWRGTLVPWQHSAGIDRTQKRLGQQLFDQIESGLRPIGSITCDVPVREV